MTAYYPIVLETEASGAVSAYIPDSRSMPRQTRALPLSERFKPPWRRILRNTRVHELERRYVWPACPIA